MKLNSGIVLLALLPACASAQARPDSIQSRNDCRLAIQVVGSGHPAPQAEWARDYVVNCGAAGGDAIASALRRTRQSSDLAELEALTQPIRTFRDGEVFRAALEVAGDRAASVPARVIAFRTAIVSVSPAGRTLSYDQMTQRDERGACIGLGGTPHDDITVGRTLPADARLMLAELAARVTSDSGEPAEVRQAARCATRHARA